MIQLALNRKKAGNYAYFDPVSRLHVTLTTPVGMVAELTDNLKSAINTGTLIQLDSHQETDVGSNVSEEVIESKPEDIQVTTEETQESGEETGKKPGRGRKKINEQ